MSVPDRVKKIRESLGKTQKDMAALIQISYRTWQNYEDGVNSPGWDVCGALVKLGFNANWLLTGEGEMKRGEIDGQVVEGQAQERRYATDPSAELMALVQERLNACIAKYGVTLPVEKTINLTMTSMRIFDGNYKDREFREMVMDSVIDNLVRLALPER